MKWRNSDDDYGLIAIIMHWLMAALVFAMFALGLWMRTLDYYHPWYHDAPEIHKSIGIILLLLLLFRWSWRLINQRPALMGAAWEQLVALLVHRMHYMLLFALMLTGYFIPTAEGVGIDVFGWLTVPALVTLDKQTVDLIGMAHLYLAWAAIALAIMHAAAAVKHHVIDHDRTLLRMLGRSPKHTTKE